MTMEQVFKSSLISIGPNSKNPRIFANNQMSKSYLKDNSQKRDSVSSQNSRISSNSIFNRINYLLMNCKQKGNTGESMAESNQRDKEMDDLLCTLICSLYLNLSRNPENIPELVSLKLFEKFSGNLTEIFNES